MSAPHSLAQNPGGIQGEVKLEPKLDSFKPSSSAAPSTPGQCSKYAGPCPYSSSPWLESYDEAIACHYSQELRAKLQKSTIEGSPDFNKCLDDEKWVTSSVSLEGSKTLTVLLAKQKLEENQAIIEFIGKFKTLSQYTPGK